MTFPPTTVNGLVTDFTSLRLSVEGGCDDTIFNVVSVSYGNRMNRELLKSNHPIGYGYSLGQYSTDTLKVVVPQEQFMDFISRQSEGCPMNTLLATLCSHLDLKPEHNALLDERDTSDI